jgi:phosphoribosylamine--glycine ligase
MGAYSPAPVLTSGIEARVMREIIEPTLAGMRARGTPFTGVLYAGLMLTREGPKLIEYNVRFGDPECQVLMPRLTSDILAVMRAACDRRLDQVSLAWADDAALTVVLAARGYPGAPEKGSRIRGLDAAEATPDVLVFHAGTRETNEGLIADGGRVLNVTAVARTVADAQERAYAAVDRIDWPEGFCRRDVGHRAVEHERS